MSHASKCTIAILLIKIALNPMLNAAAPHQITSLWMHCAKTGDIKSIRSSSRFKNKGEIDCRDDGGNGYTALYHAAAHGHAKVVQCLLEAKADCKAQMPKGSIIEAAQAHSEVAKLLEDHMEGRPYLI